MATRPRRAAGNPRIGSRPQPRGLFTIGAIAATAEDAGGRIVRDVFLALVRIHVLHHAAAQPVFGAEMMDELARHGYDIGPGTLYPMLHALEAGGLVVSRHTIVGGKTRRYYRTTRAGDALLRRLRPRIRELVDEVLQESGRKRER